MHSDAMKAVEKGANVLGGSKRLSCVFDRVIQCAATYPGKVRLEDAGYSSMVCVLNLTRRKLNNLGGAESRHFLNG